MNARTSNRAAWIIAGIACLICVASLYLYGISLRAPMPPQSFGFRGFPVLLALEFAVTGVILVRARPSNPIGWLCLGGALATSLQALDEAWGPVGRRDPRERFDLRADRGHRLRLGVVPGARVTGARHGAVPRRTPVSRRWGRWIGLCVAGALVTVVSGILTDKPLIYEGTENPLGIAGMYYATTVGSIFFFMLLLTALASLVVRLRRATRDEREQMRWIAFSVAVVVVSFTAYFIAYAMAGGGKVAANILEAVIVFGAMTIPVAIAVGILKYRLYDIDVVISKTLVYGVLAMLIALVYVAIVAGVGALVGSGTSPVLSAAAVAVIAVAFQPVRRRLQRVASRLVYGERATPHQVLSEFAERLSGSYSMEDVLPRLTRLLADGTGASEVSVWLRAGRDLRAAAAWPEEALETSDR